MYSNNGKQRHLDPEFRALLLVNNIGEIGAALERQFPEATEVISETMDTLIEHINVALYYAITNPDAWHNGENNKPVTHTVEKYAHDKVEALIKQVRQIAHEKRHFWYYN